MPEGRSVKYGVFVGSNVPMNFSFQKTFVILLNPGIKSTFRVENATSVGLGVKI